MSDYMKKLAVFMTGKEFVIVAKQRPYSCKILLANYLKHWKPLAYRSSSPARKVYGGCKAANFTILKPTRILATPIKNIVRHQTSGYQVLRGREFTHRGREPLQRGGEFGGGEDF